MAERLADVLLARGLVTPARLQAAARRAGDSTPVVAELVESGDLDGLAVVELLVARGFARADLSEVQADALREVPLEVAQRCRLLPLALEVAGGRRALRVAMADPLDAQVIRELELVTGAAVEARVAPVTELAQAIPARYGALITRVIPRARRGRVHTPTDTTRVDARSPHAAAAAAGVAASGADPAGAAALALRLEALREVLRAKALVSDEEFTEALARLAGADDEGDEGGGDDEEQDDGGEESGPTGADGGAGRGEAAP